MYKKSQLQVIRCVVETCPSTMHNGKHGGQQREVSLTVRPHGRKTNAKNSYFPSVFTDKKIKVTSINTGVYFVNNILINESTFLPLWMSSFCENNTNTTIVYNIEPAAILGYTIELMFTVW